MKFQKLTKLTALLLTFVLVLAVFAGCAEKSTVTPLLYKVTDDSGNCVWLFGSIHVAKEDTYPMPDYVLEAYDSADSIAVEFDLVEFQNDQQAQMDIALSLMYIDGTTIKQHISESVYNDARDVLTSAGVYDEAFDYYMPTMWINTIDSLLYQNSEFSSDYGIDLHFINKAKSDGKKILEIESGTTQFDMLKDFSPQLQELLLTISIDQYNNLESAKSTLEQFLNYWSAGDAEGLRKCLATDYSTLTEEQQKLMAEYEDKLSTQRDKLMTEYVADALASGEKVFVCVGAAHVIGENAMVDGLTKLGYTVENITD